ncbi:hypothetical protein LCGC14_2487690 [marine sediment metagenome]|uniref:Uncharacterized protein n=1 Tax=marine sediment metagenome TaxID=412755 RepID=A0A0F9DZH6_9ZZZZ
MPPITNHLPTADLQALDAAHHMHPFTTNDDLGKKGARVITRAKGIYLTDSEGNEILDAMAGLWVALMGLALALALQRWGYAAIRGIGRPNTTFSHRR